MRNTIKKIASIIILIILTFLNDFTFAQEKTYQQENKKDTIGLDVELKDRILIEGLKLLTAGKYEQSVFRFENYLLFRMRKLDEIVGLGAISFGAIPSKLMEGAKYFQKKIEDNPENPRLYYYKAIFEIMSLEIMNLSYHQASDDCIRMIKKYHPNSQKTHYILGLIYLLQGNVKLYKNEWEYLKNKNINLSLRLASVYDKSSFLKKAVEEMKKEKIEKEEENKQE